MMDYLERAAATDPLVVPRWLQKLSSASAAEFAAACANRALNGAEIVRSEFGYAAWRRLDWDSKLLGMSCARVEVFAPHSERDGALLADVVVAWRAAGIEYGILRVPSENLRAAAACTSAGWRLVDGTISLGMIRAEMTEPTGTARDTIRTVESHDLPRLLQLVAAVFTVDRFHSDPVIQTGRADALHCEWIRNTVSRSSARVPTWVVEQDGEVHAFLSTTFDAITETVLGAPVLTIDLVGTVAEARRAGHATTLTRIAVGHAATHGFAAVQVGTQLANIGAIRVYESTGFRTHAVRLTYRWHHRESGSGS